jgi:hypothetical protein
VYLNGRPEPELAGEVARLNADRELSMTMGGNGSAECAFEGKLSEVSVYDRICDAQEISQHYAAAALHENP